MKKAIILFSTLLTIAACGASSDSQLMQSKQSLSKSDISIGFGSYTLVDSPDADLSGLDCVFTLDMDIINGPTGGSLRLGNNINGACAVTIDRDEREYELVKVEESGCGSKVYHGIRVGEKSMDKVALTDHRNRTCRDLVAHTLVLEETTSDAAKSWYSPSFRTFDVDPDRMTCMAYWTGFEINSATNTCEARGTSGCGNPFRFETANECATFFRLD